MSLNYSAGSLRRLLNTYGPYLGAAVKVDYIAKDFKEIRVSMRLRWYNKNAVGTHFGGSLYAMVDPHLMLMLMKLLGPDYMVWDKSASIDFLQPGTGKVSATIRIDNETLQTIEQAVAVNRKYQPEFSIQVVDEKDRLVCRVNKILYVRKKRPAKTG